MIVVISSNSYLTTFPKSLPHLATRLPPIASRLLANNYQLITSVILVILKIAVADWSHPISDTLTKNSPSAVSSAFVVAVSKTGLIAEGCRVSSPNQLPINIRSC